MAAGMRSLVYSKAKSFTRMVPAEQRYTYFQPSAHGTFPAEQFAELFHDFCADLRQPQAV